MKIMTIHVDGNKYAVELDKNNTLSDAAESLYNKVPLKRMKLELVTGAFIVLGADVLSRSYFTFEDTGASVGYVTDK